MDAGAAKYLLSRSSTSNMSVGLRHKQSKLDLLDSKTLTSFPLPNISEDSGNSNSFEGVSSRTTDVSQLSSFDSIYVPKRWKSSMVLGEYKAFNKNDNNGVNIDKSASILRSRTTSSVQTMDTVSNIMINSNERMKHSLTDSMVSKTLVGSSKMTTPPSSLDYESTFYDYKLVLKLSEQNGNPSRDICEDNIADETTKTGGSATIENTKNENTDMYIQSLYQELMQKDESKPQIQCMVCDLPVFEDAEYFSRILDFKGVVCENCIQRHDSDNDTEDRASRTHSSAEDVVSLASAMDLYSLIDETNHTIQIQLDTTIQSDEDSTEYGIYGNMDFFRNDHTGNKFYGTEKGKNDNFGKIIRQLRRIERTDLRIRQSIADLRSRNELSNEYTSMWSSVKNRFTNV